MATHCLSIVAVVGTSLTTIARRAFGTVRHTAPLPHTFRKLEKLLSLGRNSSWRPHLRSSHHCHDHWCSFISRVNLLFTALCRIYAISATCLSLPYPLLSRKLPSICMLLQASITEFLYWAGRHVFWHGLTTLSKPCPLAWLFPNPLICCTAIKLPTAGRPAADNLSRIVSPPPHQFGACSSRMYQLWFWFQGQHA